MHFLLNLRLLPDAVVNQAHNFVSASRVFSENTPDGACYHSRAGFFDSANGHTTVGRLEHDGHALRLEISHNKIGNLISQSLLGLQPTGKAIDDSSELADAQDFT